MSLEKGGYMQVESRECVHTCAHACVSVKGAEKCSTLPTSQNQHFNDQASNY